MMYISATPVAIAVRYTGTSRAQEIGISTYLSCSWT
jgi:hypothetical protein